MAFGIAAEDVRLLAEIGFLGIGRGKAAEAAVIFASLCDLRPEAEAGHVGAALADLSLGRIDAAEARLRSAPQSEAVIAFRALVLGRMGERRKSDDLMADLKFMRAGQAVTDIARGAALTDL